MNVAFIELHTFSRVRDDYFADDDDFREFQNALMVNPRLGAVIPSCGGVRKVRWRDPARGKGKRGGLRVIYLFLEELATIVLLTVYGKNVATDLTAEQRKAFTDLAQSVQADLRALQRKQS